MEDGLEFFDTNVLVAAVLRRHVHHAAASARLAAIPAGLGACAAHTLAETYNTLTNTSRGYSVPPQDAVLLIEQAAAMYRVVTLTAEEGLATIASVARENFPGAIVYDALLIACARKINARWIYTNNVKHFRRVTPDLASRIVEP